MIFLTARKNPCGHLFRILVLGAGYTTTVLNVTDLYGDLSGQASMQDFGGRNQWWH